MKQYISLFKVQFFAGLQYRGAAIAGIVTQFAWGFLSIALFTVFNTNNMEPEHLSTFFWLRQSCIALIAVWAADNSIFTIIENGGVAYESVRPTDLYSLWFVRNIAYRTSRFLLRFLPIVLIAFFLPAPFNMILPVSFSGFIYFLISMVLVVLLLVSINMIVYIAAIKMKSSMGIRVFTMSLFELLDGSNIPYPFFPIWAQTILKYTFFYGLQTTPFFIYLGLINPISAILIQLGWLIVIVSIGKAWMKKSLYKLEVFGG